MKKLLLYALFISSSIILLSPLNAFADTLSEWHNVYKTENGGAPNNVSGYNGSYASGLNPGQNYTTSIYPNGISFTANTFDYIDIPFYISATGDSNTTNSTMYTIPNANTMYYVYNGLQLNFSIIYTNGAYNNTAYCEVLSSNYTGSLLITGILRCNVNRIADGIKSVRVSHILSGYSLDSTYDFFFGVNGWFSFVYKNDNGTNSITGAINNQTSSITQAQQGTTNAINNLDSDLKDSSTTDANNSGNSFFNGFRTESFGHLTDIITAPLTLFSAMTSTTCSPITLNVDFSDSTNGAVGSNDVVLPCGTTLFWENSSLGSKVSNFRTFWNILLGAPLIYGCLLLLVKAIDSALDPLNDELITLNVSKNDDKRIEKIQKQDELKKQARGGS